MHILAALDPAMLVFDEDDCLSGGRHFDERLSTLFLHREFVDTYSLGYAVTQEYLDELWMCYPYSAPRDVRQKLYDLRVVLERLQRYAVHLSSQPSRTVELASDCVLGMCVEKPRVNAAFRRLLGEALAWSRDNGLGFHVGTWPSARLTVGDLCVTRAGDGGQATGPAPDSHCVALVWTRDGWAGQLFNVDWWWPDLPRLVQLCFEASPSLRGTVRGDASPAALGLTDGFAKSLDRHCLDPNLRRALVETVTRLVYGIPDGAMNDKKFHGHRRCRVSDFWRLYYSREQAGVTLLDFVPHE